MYLQIYSELWSTFLKARLNINVITGLLMLIKLSKLSLVITLILDERQKINPYFTVYLQMEESISKAYEAIQRYLLMTI